MKIIPSPPNHWSSDLQILMEYATGTSEYIVKPVDVNPDMLSKYASIHDKSWDNIIGSAEKNAESSHTERTKIMDPFNESSDILLDWHVKYNNSPTVSEMISEAVNE